MCIALVTTAHPSYALIVIDNRDEFILRPTSRPHWWRHSANGQPNQANGHVDDQEVLSSRDLQRAERGTWLGITRAGHLAVLTNYHEENFQDASDPMHKLRSRGAIVTAWLGASKNESTRAFVARMLEKGGLKGIGGFSLICGKLRRRRTTADHADLEPLAILSNRSDHPEQVPWIAVERGAVYGLSNTVYGDPETWPKVKRGKQMLRDVATEAYRQQLDENALVQRLFAILDEDSLPLADVESFEGSLGRLSESVFIRPLGDAAHKQAMEEAKERVGSKKWSDVTEVLKEAERPDGDAPQGFNTGMFGTQRQTIVLVDWEGVVTYIERALWDANGNPVERGAGDVRFRFKIEGWDD